MKNKTDTMPPLPSDVFDPARKPRIISHGTEEWEALQEQKKRWLQDNAPPEAPPCPYHLADDGVTWEMRYVSEDKLRERRKAENAPQHVFKVVVHQGAKQFDVLIGNRTHSFGSTAAVVRFVQRSTDGARTRIDYFKPPSASDRAAGDNVGDFISSEEFGRN